MRAYLGPQTNRTVDSHTDNENENENDSSLVVYYESIKRKLNRRLIYECWCDERLKANTEGSIRLTSHIHWVTRGTGTPKDRDEVNRREVCECGG